MHEDECPECEGTGTVSYWVGTYGTSTCHGEAERDCDLCAGKGWLDYD